MGIALARVSMLRLDTRRTLAVYQHKTELSLAGRREMRTFWIHRLPPGRALLWWRGHVEVFRVTGAWLLWHCNHLCGAQQATGSIMAQGSGSPGSLLQWLCGLYR